MSSKENNTLPDGGYRKHWNPCEHYTDRAVAEAYDAQRFSSLAGKIYSWLERRSLRKAISGILTGAHILDCPCGTGRLAEVLLELGYQVTGIDISPAMLDVARRKLSRFGAKFSHKVLDARRLDHNERYAAALCARVLMHFPLDEQVGFLNGLARTTDLIVLTHSLNTPYQRCRRGLKRILRQPGPVAYPVTESELAILLSRVGFREVRRFRPMPLLSEAIIVVAQGAASR